MTAIIAGAVVFKPCDLSGGMFFLAIGRLV